VKALLAAPLAAAAVVIPATPAEADKADCPKPLEESYSRAYHQVAHKHGTRAPGRNIRRYGVLYRKVVFTATCGEIRRSRAQLRKLLRVPEPTMFSRAVPPPQPPAGVQSDFNQAALPDCTWRPESGGSYSAYNQSSGAYGKYQVIPSTWAAHCAGLDRGPAGQEQCAARVWQAQGAGAWVGC
jgi:hypothetical protein